MSESRPLRDSGEPSGVGTDARLASTSSFPTGIETLTGWLSAGMWRLPLDTPRLGTVNQRRLAS
jgi:hypothetical protein